MLEKSVQADLRKLVAARLSTLGAKYGFSDESYERRVHAKPIVLVIGNYSAGKSSFINSFIGKEVQSTGQGPEDDSFTVIVGEQGAKERSLDGSTLLQDSSYPFEILEEQGNTFRAHFRGKVVDSAKLEGVVLIDTPGMLDSATDTERGYDYQSVLKDFARIADLVVVMFDTHKAGTVYESYVSLRETLPQATFEDRVVFVLNRVDECGTIHDLLRVYGTLCWNLSQMTRRKDIPRIYLSHLRSNTSNLISSLPEEINQRENLFADILSLKDARWFKVLGFLEDTAKDLQGYLEQLESCVVERRAKARVALVFGLFFSLGCVLSIGWSWGLEWRLLVGVGVGFIAVYVAALWKLGMPFIHRIVARSYRFGESPSEEADRSLWVQRNAGSLGLWSLRKDLKKVEDFRVRIAAQYRQQLEADVSRGPLNRAA